MGTLHDLASRSLAAASVRQHIPARPAQQPAADTFPSVSPGKDVLSDVLRAVKLTGALFF